MNYIDFSGNYQVACAERYTEQELEMTAIHKASVFVAVVLLCTSQCFAADYDCPEADVSGDCKVNLKDFAQLALAWLNGPTCPADYEDCDGSELNACEAHLLTNYHNCGTCGYSCADFPDTYCNDSSCVPFICPDKWADCDSDPNNGCETNLAQDTNTCTSPHDFGVVKGDIGSDQVQYTGHGSRWFRFLLLEADYQSQVDISANFNLIGPAATVYKMDIFRGGCGGEYQIYYGAGYGDLCLCWTDWPSDDTNYLYIRIYPISGTTCDDYTLTITGNTGCGYCM